MAVVLSACCGVYQSPWPPEPLPVQEEGREAQAAESERAVGWLK